MSNGETSAWFEEAKKSATTLIALGIVEVIAGVFAITSPLIAGITVIILVGMMLVVCGITRLIGVFKAGSFGAGLPAFLSGVFAVAVGAYMVFRPGIGLTGLTLVLAVYLFVDGVTRVALGFKMKPAKGWGTTMFGGVAGIFIGFLIWRQWPLSGAWLVGTLMGVHLLITGWTVTGIGFAARKGTSAVKEAVGAAGVS